MWFRNWERVYLSYLIHTKSVYFDFSFGLAVDVIRISIRCGVDMWQWRSGGKNIILKAQFYLLTGTTTWFLEREIRQLLREMKLHLLKSELSIDQLMVLSKLRRLLVQYSITRMTKKGIMIFFVIGGKSISTFHLPSQTLQTIAFSHTAMLLLLCCSIFNFSENF